MNRRHFLAASAAFLLASQAGRAVARPQMGLIRSPAPQPVPDVSFQSVDGNVLSLNDFSGRAILLNLWASWCLPCLAELPSLDRLKAQADDKKLAVLAVSMDASGWPAAKAAFARIGIQNLNLYLDTQQDMAAKLRAPFLPMTLLIDPQGREAARFQGPADWASPQALAVLNDLSAGRALTDVHTIPVAQLPKVAP